MKFEKISVEAYSGYKVNERPVSFLFRGRWFRVVEIRDRWYEGRSVSPQLDYFKVRADDHRDYLLRYNSLFDIWSIIVPEEN